MYKNVDYVDYVDYKKFIRTVNLSLLYDRDITNIFYNFLVDVKNNIVPFKNYEDKLFYVYNDKIILEPHVSSKYFFLFHGIFYLYF